MARLALAVSLLLALLVAAPAASGSTYVDFRTPSGKIGCGWYKEGSRESLRCDILNRNSLPRRPASCDADYGHAFAMTRHRRARAICAGDTVVNQRAAVLGYGRTKRIGGFRCTSRTSGLTCKNLDGHGWFLSRERVKLF